MRRWAGIALGGAIIVLGWVGGWHHPAVFLAQSALLLVELVLLWPFLRPRR